MAFSHIFWSKITNGLVFVNFDSKRHFQALTPYDSIGCVWVEWDKPFAIYAIFSHFCCVGIFGDSMTPWRPL